MPQIAPLPIDSPVTLPEANPKLFGSVGQTVAGLGEETEQLAQVSSQVDEHLIAADRQLKAKQAQIAFDAQKLKVYDELRKATTAEDAQAIYDRSKGELDHVLAPFETDRVLSRELGLYRQQEEVEMQGTVNAKKAEIITKGDQAANTLLGEKSLQTAINTAVGGGDPTVSRDQYNLQLQSSVVHGTMSPEQYDLAMNKWDKEYEAGYIEAQLHSLNLQTIQDTVNDLRQHPEKYPHLDRGELNALADKGEGEVVSRMSRQDEINAKAEQSRYWNESSTGIPKMFTDSSGNFNADAAETYVAKQGLSPEGEKLLLGDIKVHDAAASAAFRKTAIKQENDIVESLNAHDYKKANGLLAQYKTFSEEHPEFRDNYKSLAVYEDTKRREELSLSIEGMRVQTEVEQLKMRKYREESFATLGQVQYDIANGRHYTDTELYSMAGQGKGKMATAQVTEALKLAHSYEDDPQNKPFYKAFASEEFDKATTGELITEFNSWLAANPKASSLDKATEVRRITDQSNIDRINKGIDSISEKLNKGATPQEGQDNRIGTAVDEMNAPDNTGDEAPQPRVIERRTTPSGKKLEKLDDGTIREAK